MKITRLEAENYKRIKVVRIDPDGHVQVVAGRNAQGKTSVLDAIEAALAYASSKKGTTKPVRDGEDSGRIVLDLGDLVVTRTFTSDGKSQLRVESPEGARYPSPQKVLDELVGRLSFDPLAFAQASAKDQLATLLELVELPFDADTLAGKRQALYERRTDTNRRAKALDGQIGGMKVPPADLPAEEESASELIAQVRTAEAANRHHVELTQERNELQETIAELKDRLVQAEDRHDIVNAQLADLTTVDVDPLHERLNDLEQTNAQIREGAKRREAIAQRDDLTSQVDELTRQINALDDLKANALANAELPIDGLGFDDDGVTYQGQPFAQASGAEQLRVSLAMAMALNPKLRVIRITDASLLDDNNRKLIDDMCAEKDFQVWLEVVGDAGGVGVVLEDGEVVS